MILDNYEVFSAQAGKHSASFATIPPIAPATHQTTTLEFRILPTVQAEVLPYKQESHATEQDSSIDKTQIVTSVTEATEHIATSLIKTLSKTLEMNLGFDLVCKYLGLTLKFTTQIKL